MTTRHDRYRFHNTLASLLKGLEGHETTIELRNETSIRGCIVHVDASMNAHIENAEVIRPDGIRRNHFEQFFVQVSASSNSDICVVWSTHYPGSPDALSTI